MLYGIYIDSVMSRLPKSLYIETWVIETLRYLCKSHIACDVLVVILYTVS